MIKVDNLHLYVLNGHEPEKITDFDSWGLFWLQNETKKIVAQDQINDFLVSTVFLTVDVNHGLTDKPILFETRVFGGPFDGSTKRCSTWKQAEKNHADCLEMIKRQTVSK